MLILIKNQFRTHTQFDIKDLNTRILLLHNKYWVFKEVVNCGISLINNKKYPIIIITEYYNPARPTRKRGACIGRHPPTIS